MIEMLINDNEHISNIKITKNNCILHKNKIEIYKLYKYFEDLLNLGEEIEIRIGNKKIAKKNTYLVNIQDFDYIYKNLEFKKNSLLYNYVENIYNKIDEETLEEINNIINQKIMNINKNNNLNLSLELDNSLFKILNQNYKINSKLNYKDNIKELKIILNNMINENRNKTFIIFYDSNFVNFNYSIYENVICFNCSNNLNIEEYNLISFNEIKEFNFEILFDNLKEDWPTNYNEKELKQNLMMYFNLCFNYKSFKTNNPYILVISKLVNKYYGFSQSVTYEECKINNNIKSFLTS